MDENKIFLIKIDILVKEISECVEKFQMNVAVAKMAEDFGVPPENVRFDDFGG